VRARVGGKVVERTWSFTTADPEALDAEAARHLLGRLNDFRKAAGLLPVAFDGGLSDACRKHARYLALNADHPAVQGLGVHNEDPRLPGATPEGARAAKAAVLANLSDPLEAVDGWMSTLYHRVPLLDPRLERVGYGQARLPGGNWAVVLASPRPRR
jgi:uncharacterized protein YkwD